MMCCFISQHDARMLSRPFDASCDSDIQEVSYHRAMIRDDDEEKRGGLVWMQMSNTDKSKQTETITSKSTASHITENVEGEDIFCGSFCFCS